MENLKTLPRASKSRGLIMNNLHINIKPEWDELKNVMSAVSDFLLPFNLSNDIIHAMVMVSNELAGNAVKYGYFQNEAKISLDLSINKTHITIEVRNPIHESNEYHLQKLDKTIQWIRGYQDSFEAYTMKLKELAKSDLNCDESGLGLVRIAYEGESIIDFFVDENNIIAVSAIFSL
ncbi:MAG: hypothetical protein IEMM0008_0755 [bacterium]|nr:MAG: hypothetical protein IEMM0008_0755 [bacterium]